MKIRNGFVSNSSSSSFIIGIAKINDIDKLRKYIKINNIDVKRYDIKIISKYDVINDKPRWSMSIKDNKVSIESFSYDTVSLDMSKMSPLDNFIIFDFTGNEGDSDFYDDYGDYDLDYGIGLSFFEEKERKIYNMFSNKESGIDLETSDVKLGAGRNG